MKKSILRSDKFRKSRGGFSRLLEISCAKCATPVCYYQKDGPGILKRLYLDRISGNASLTGLQKNSFKKLTPLVCQHCQELLGIPMIYKKEDRLAFRLFAGSVAKKIINADKVIENIA